MTDDRRRFAELFRVLLECGYSPQSVVDAVIADDLGKLQHSAPFSVQLQPPHEDEGSPPPDCVT